MKIFLLEIRNLIQLINLIQKKNNFYLIFLFKTIKNVFFKIKKNKLIN